MTYDAKYLIELSDILGVELYCHMCKGKVVLEKTAENKMFLTCPLCNKPWLDDGSKEEQNIHDFVNLLRSVAELLPGRDFSLRLQITPPPFEPKSSAWQG